MYISEYPCENGKTGDPSHAILLFFSSRKSHIHTPRNGARIFALQNDRPYASVFRGQ